MITLQKLSWNNCFSYGEGNELVLDDNTVTQIIGTNGVGKSSIPLIIEEALYNKNSKGIKKADIPNRYIDKGYNIKLEFSKGNDNFSVEVTRKAAVKVVLKKNGEDISSHTATNTYKSIQGIIGVDFKTFSQLVYQNTNASLQFLTATDSNRKKFLIDLLRLEKYVELFEIFKDASKEASTMVSSAKTEIATINSWLTDNKLKDTNVQPLIKTEINTEVDEKELSKLTVELENISEKNTQIAKNNDLIKTLQTLDLSRAQETCSLPIKCTKEQWKTLYGYLGQIEAAEQALEKLSKLGNICPTCTQDIDTARHTSLCDDRLQLITSLSAKVTELKEEVNEIDRYNNEIVVAKQAEQKWTDTFRSINRSLPSSIVDPEELRENISELCVVLKEKRGRIKDINSENQEIAKRNTRIQVIQEQTQEFITKLGEATKKLSKYADKDADLEVLKKAFSTNGLVAYKIENLVVELEEVANKYLAELSDGRFTLGFNVQKDKLNVAITDNGNPIDILALSSGELARVNTATLIAIRKLMSSISKSKINILFLDEVINVLDDVGREKMVELLIKEEELNTYIVSHGWTHPLLDKIEVVKETNVSRLEW